MKPPDHKPWFSTQDFFFIIIYISPIFFNCKKKKKIQFNDKSVENTYRHRLV